MSLSVCIYVFVCVKGTVPVVGMGSKSRECPRSPHKFVSLSHNLPLSLFIKPQGKPPANEKKMLIFLYKKKYSETGAHSTSSHFFFF